MVTLFPIDFLRIRLCFVVFHWASEVTENNMFSHQSVKLYLNKNYVEYDTVKF